MIWPMTDDSEEWKSGPMAPSTSAQQAELMVLLEAIEEASKQLGEVWTSWEIHTWDRNKNLVSLVCLLLLVSTVFTWQVPVSPELQNVVVIFMVYINDHIC